MFYLCSLCYSLSFSRLPTHSRLLLPTFLVLSALSCYPLSWFLLALALCQIISAFISVISCRLCYRCLHSVVLSHTISSGLCSDCYSSSAVACTPPPPPIVDSRLAGLLNSAVTSDLCPSYLLSSVTTSNNLDYYQPCLRSCSGLYSCLHPLPPLVFPPQPPKINPHMDLSCVNALLCFSSSSAVACTSTRFDPLVMTYCQATALLFFG